MSTTVRRSAAPRPQSLPAQGPLWNALLVTIALAASLWLLVARGRLSWPPSELLASTYTVAGCLALVGPLVLSRREGGESGLGELLWMTGGVLVWIHNAAAVLRGDFIRHSWATPLPAAPLGLCMLAVLVSGWRLRAGAGRGWTWTNVVGWLLGAYWVGMGLYALVPSAAATGLAAR